MLKTASLVWSKEGHLRSDDFDDIYFQPEHSIDEVNHVFLESNSLAERFSALKSGQIFRIAELGFGTGLNFLLTWRLWQKYAPKGARLCFVSFEKHPILKTDLENIYRIWPELSEQSEKLVKLYPEPIAGFHDLHFGDVNLLLGLGDVLGLLPQIDTVIDAWFLDGFSPAKNPDMWSKHIFSQMQRLTINGGTLSTFTAAQAVGEGLKEAGFSVAKIRGYGRKRTMFIGIQKHNKYLKRKTRPKHALVIGAGIAGCSVAYALAKRGIKVTILEKNNQIADAASGNTIGVSYPRLTAAPSIFSDFYSHAFFHTARVLQELGDKTGFCQTGALMLDYDDAMAAKNDGIFTTSGWPKTTLQRLNKLQASKLASVDISKGGLYFPNAGYLAPRKFCRVLLEAYPDLIELKTNCLVDDITYNQETKLWSVGDYGADMLVLASGSGIAKYQQSNWLPLQYVGGQVTSMPVTDNSAKLKIVIGHKGYIPPAVDGVHYAGSTFQKLKQLPKTFEETTDGHVENLRVISEQLPSLGMDKISAKDRTGRAEIRTTTPDHLPVIGRVPVLLDWQIDYAGLEHGKLTYKNIDFNTAAYYPNLYVTGAFGSHGMTSAPLAGEMIANQVVGNPLPVTQDVARYVHSGRFILRALKRNKAI